MKKIKGILGLGLVLALIVSMVPTESAKAAKTYVINEITDSIGDGSDEVGSLTPVFGGEIYRVTVSTDKPQKGSVITATRPQRPEEAEYMEFYVVEIKDEDIVHKTSLSEYDGTLSKELNTVSVTLETDCDFVYFDWGYGGEGWTAPQMGYGPGWFDDGNIYIGFEFDWDYCLTPNDGSADSAAVSLAEGPEGTVYRLGNPTNGDHIYTVNKDEAKALVESGWNQETSPGISSGTDGVAIYRLTNNANGEHLFTADKNEKNFLSKNGWTVDNDGNPAFYGSESGKAVYRLFNPNAQSALDSHHFTLDKNEIKVLTTQFGWVIDNDGKAVYYLN